MHNREQLCKEKSTKTAGCLESEVHKDAYISRQPTDSFEDPKYLRHETYI